MAARDMESAKTMESVIVTLDGLRSIARRRRVLITATREGFVLVENVFAGRALMENLVRR
jgi:hypothetical protein